jgi:homocysteine S-methyltransferase
MLLLDGGSTSINNFLPSPPPSISPPLSKLWTSSYSLLSPSAVRQWHTSFLNAGSNIITTNTYQIPLAEDVPEIDVPTFIRSAVEIAVDTAKDRGSVALSLGTMNAIFGKEEYSTEAKATIQEYASFHRERIRQFYSACKELWDDIEYLAFETISSYEEAEAILMVLSEESITHSKKAWITFSCGDASIARMNDIFSRLVKLPTILSLWGIGVNCVGIDIAVELARMIAEKIVSTELTLVVYPDARRWGDKTTAQFTYEAPPQSDQDASKWAAILVEITQLNKGIVLLGGCCNTDSRFISALSALRSIGYQ